MNNEKSGSFSSQVLGGRFIYILKDRIGGDCKQSRSFVSTTRKYIYNKNIQINKIKRGQLSNTKFLFVPNLVN